MPECGFIRRTNATGVDMKYSIPFAILVMALGLSACDRPADKTVVVPSAVPGPPGPQGSPGDQGNQGATGSSGSKGEPGYTGEQGETGEPGTTGRTGEQGKTGDGSTIVIVPPPP